MATSGTDGGTHIYKSTQNSDNFLTYLEHLTTDSKEHTFWHTFLQTFSKLGTLSCHAVVTL